MDGFDRNIRALRASTTARSLIIGYGIAAFSFLMLRSDVSGVISPGIGMFVAGILFAIGTFREIERHL